MIRYRRLRNVAKMWRILEFLVAFALLSWSSTRLPIIVSLAGQCLVQLSDYLFNPHINFVIGNAIIIVIVFLSRQNKAGNNSVTGDEYGNGKAHQRIASISDGATPSPPPPTAAEMEETAYEDKQIVVSENAVTQMQCDAASTAIEQAKKQIQRFQRTESEKLKRDLQANHRPQLRRSETEIKERSVVRRRAISSFDAVDRLNSDEFRRTVESFIAEQRRFLRTQKMDETNHFLIDAYGFECTGKSSHSPAGPRQRPKEITRVSCCSFRARDYNLEACPDLTRQASVSQDSHSGGELNPHQVADKASLRSTS